MTQDVDVTRALGRVYMPLLTPQKLCPDYFATDYKTRYRSAVTRDRDVSQRSTSSRVLDVSGTSLTKVVEWP